MIPNYMLRDCRAQIDTPVEILQKKQKHFYEMVRVRANATVFSWSDAFQLKLIWIVYSL